MGTLKILGFVLKQVFTWLRLSETQAFRVSERRDYVFRDKAYVFRDKAYVFRDKAYVFRDKAWREARECGF